MRHIHLAGSAGRIAPLRIALIAGAHQEPEDFEREGFAAAVKDRGLDIDLEFIAPGLQHLLDRSVLDSLRLKIVSAARNQGCRHVWLGGISLGGYIALAFAERWPRDVGGLCLLAPYLGNRIVTTEISHAGGLDAWRPKARADDDEDRKIWQFIRALKSRDLRVHLGVGRQDRFLHGHKLFADALPQPWVDMIDGGHEWPTWLKLWERFLDRIADANADGTSAA